MFKLIRKKSKRKNRIHEKNINLIRNSEYFDEEYYKSENPQLKIDPCTHYYYKGWKKGISPSYKFSTKHYLENNPDVKNSGINPLLHYLKYGQYENRKIYKDIGISLIDIYQKRYNFAYSYKTYQINEEKKILNLFFDKIDNDIIKIKNLLKFIIDLSKKKKYIIRIIYNESNFSDLKNILEKNDLRLPKNTLFINLKTDNYLEIHDNDIYISTSWKSTLALLRNKLIDKMIYFYIDNFNSDDITERYYYTKSCNNKQVICLTENQPEILGIDLNFTTNDKKIKLSDKNKLYCDFNELTLIGIEFLNNLFKNKILEKKWNIKLLKRKNVEKFHLDNEIIVTMCKKIENDCTLLISCLNNENSEQNFPAITILQKQKKYLLNNYINILDKESIDKIKNKTIKINLNDELEYLEFNDKINNMLP